MSPTDGLAVQAVNGVMPNGMSPSEGDHGSANGHGTKTAASLPETATGSPPPLDQSWRQSAANKPMGKLLQRLANQCLKDLRDTVSSMAEVPIDAKGPQTNGIVSHAVDKSKPSVEKKLQLMRFANDQRDRFIKMLVLADWSKREEDMARLVDLKVWQEKEINAQQNALHFLGLIKRDMFAAKMPNPNIEGALEILSTGKDVRQPHLGYLPATRLTAQQLLRTLQDMNVILITRLNLHEELPFHFNQYEVANGRATFRVPGEFEVDLSVAEEDLSSPFYFIDVRFLFQPRANIVAEGLRPVLEARINQALAAKGLQGCYDFLPNFILTHKLNILRQQAVGLVQDKWFDCLRIEDWRRVHRVLVVQYWAQNNGKKSWVELGVVTGKQDNALAHHPSTPRLRMRCFRSKGEPSLHDDVDVDWDNLDFEKILLAALAKHVTWTLSQIRDHLIRLGGTNSRLAVTLATSDETPDHCSLTLTLPGLSSPVIISQEPITGQILIRPSTVTFAQAQNRLNADPNRDPLYVAQMLAHLIGNDVRDRIARLAELVGWQTLTLLKHDPKVLSKLFGQGVLALRAYHCRNDWRSPWALALTVGLTGEKWWIVRSEVRNDPAGAFLGHVLSSARAIPNINPLKCDTPVSRELLLDVERQTTAEMFFTTVAKDLRSKAIPHKLATIRQSSKSRLASVDDCLTTAVFIPALPLRSDTSGRKRALKVLGPIRLTQNMASFHNSESEQVSRGLEVRLQVAPGQLPHLQKYLTSKQTSKLEENLTLSAEPLREMDLAMTASGALSVRARPALDRGCVECIQARLEAVQRMDQYLKTLAKYRINCDIISLARIRLTYSDSPVLSARLSFSNDGSLPLKLRLEPAGTNPHLRIRSIMEQNMNAGGRDCISVLVRMLRLTLPLLQAAEGIEAAFNKEQNALLVHPRSFGDYLISCKAPLPRLNFQVTLRSRTSDAKAEPVWRIAQLRPSSPVEQPAGLEQALNEDFKHEGLAWWGAKSCVVAKASGIGQALEHLAETLRKFVSADGGTPQLGNRLANTESGTEHKPGFDVARPNDNTKTAKPPAAQPRRPSTVNRKKSAQSKQEIIELD